MSRDLKNKIAVLTGGAEGIGYQIANHFLKNGVKKIILLDINETAGNQAVKSLTAEYGTDKVVYLKCDVAEDLERVSDDILKKYKYIDVLVNNAGISNEADAKKCISVNLLAVIEWSMKFWELMRTDKGGKGGTIINVASIYGFRIIPHAPFYNASKFGVLGFTKSLGHAYNFNKSGVRVVALCPSYTESNLITNAKLRDQKVLEDFREFCKDIVLQTSDVVGTSAVEVFQKAKSGTAWVIEEGKLRELTS